MSERPKYDEGMPAEHPTQSKRSFFRADDFLRDHGFQIHKRPRYGPDLWERGGQTFTVEEAMAICEGERAAREGT